MQLLNNPEKTIETKPKIMVKVPLIAEGFRFKHSERILRLFQFRGGEFVAAKEGDWNRWSDNVIYIDSFQEDMDKHYPGWSAV